MVSTLQETGADAICLLPSGHKDAFGITAELITATKKAVIPNRSRRTVVIDLEAMVMEAKGDASTETGHSLVVICRGFYAEHLLYCRQAQEEGKLPLPIGISHKVAPMALSDVAEFMVLTGPQLTAGDELATAASQALDKGLKFEDISEYTHAPFVHTVSEGEVAYLLEYYALVREGKANYISTTAFHDVTGKYPVEPTFFKQYAEKVRPKANKKRKSQ
ncbi:hypothetical protein BDW68DRAFT_182901 [Aspergillus falconensis]